MKLDVDDYAVQTERLTCAVVALSSRFDVPRATLEHLIIGRIEDWVADRIIYTLRTYILGAGEEKVECYERWPTDWLEAFKERWAPRWALKRWPVRYAEHQINRTFYRRMCPHVSIPPHIGNHAHFEFLKEAK